jgi:hypothetical protein
LRQNPGLCSGGAPAQSWLWGSVRVVSSDPHFAEPALGLAEGKTRGFHAGYITLNSEY